MKIEHYILASDYLPTPTLKKLHITASQYNNRNKLAFYTMIDRPTKSMYDVGVWHVKKNKK